MKKETAEKFNALEKEIKKIDSFLENVRTLGCGIEVHLLKKKFRFKLKAVPYGPVAAKEFEVYGELNSKILEVIRNYRDELIAQQEEL
ncbi:MAG: hypothetical protein LKF43_00275 [Streptococcaceae bacterium]|jgi:hypothetical protein|nr:hypothetical protein [Streptococcaceae bacterium]